MRLPDELIFLKNRNSIQKHSNARMEGKTCVITGATSGVGRATLTHLAENGADIVMVCRDRQKTEKVREQLIDKYGIQIDYFIADFSKLYEVRKTAEDICAKYPRIDVLINNAGMHSTKLTYTDEGFETVFCVNHLASFLFTMLLLDRMKESVPARIIQVNSEGHRFNGLDPDDLNWEKRHYTGLRGYGASKTAQLMTVWELSERLKCTGLTINAVHPGDVKTNIGSNNGWIYKVFKKGFIEPILKDVSISGEAVYYHASSPEMENVSGKYFNLTIEEKPAKHALDQDVAEKIWDKSMIMTGLK